MFGSSFLAFVQLSIIFSLSLFSEGLSRSENNGPTLDNIFDIRPSEKGNNVVSGSISPTFYEHILYA
jgi:hypothetical protein